MANQAGEQVKTRYGFVYCLFTDHQQDKTLILLHGNSSSGNFWKPLVESHLRKAFNFLVFDLPGHGQSPVPEDPSGTYSFPAYSDLLVEIISHYDVKNYVLFGHSLGGHVILESLERLGGCKGVVLMGTPPLTIPPQLEMAFNMSPQFISFMQSGSDRDVIEQTFKSMLPEEKEDLAGLLFEDYFKTDPRARDFLNRNIHQGKFIDELKVLKQTKVPVCLVVSENDQMVNSSYFKNFLPDQELNCISGAGHYAPLEKPEIFAELILKKFVA